MATEVSMVEMAPGVYVGAVDGDGIMHIGIRVKGSGRPSASGKTELLATTGKGLTLHGGTLAVNYYRRMQAGAPTAVAAPPKPKTVLLKARAAK